MIQARESNQTPSSVRCAQSVSRRRPDRVSPGGGVQPVQHVAHAGEAADPVEGDRSPTTQPPGVGQLVETLSRHALAAAVRAAAGGVRWGEIPGMGDAIPRELSGPVVEEVQRVAS